mmetsp:Transcript_35226/g.84981  ORF Transcript_35226/g.84981 Transcript_35226/m.84981 type:complete len:296 (+) Transcript_35226:316-1203(+)
MLRLSRKINQGVDDVFHVLQVQLIPLLLIKLTHLLHASVQSVLSHPVPILRGILPHVIGDLHAAKLGSTHTAEVRGLGRVAIESLVVECARRHGVEREVELIVPTKFESGLGESVVSVLRPGEILGEVGGVRGDLVGDDAGLDVVAIGKSEMLLGGDVTEHGGAERGDVGSADGRGDVIVAGGDVGRERSEGVEGCLVAPVKLIAHVLWNLVQGDVSGSLVHDLHVLLPGPFGEVSLGHELSELGFVIGVIDATRAQAISDGEGDIVLSANVKDVVPMLVGEVFLVVEDVPFGVD